MKTKVLTVPKKNHRPKRFLVLSDLHIGSRKDLKVIEKVNTHIKDRMAKLRITYDAVFIVGDIVDSTDILGKSGPTYETLLELIYTLSSIAPVYIATGNHDLCSKKRRDRAKSYWWKRDNVSFQSRIIDELDDTDHPIIARDGIFDLDDEYQIAIFNPPIEYMLKSPDGNDKYLKKNEHLYSFLKKLKPSKTNILLCHYPNVVRHLQRHGFIENVDLAVCGHTHHGMAQFLFLEPLLDALGQKNRGLITPGKSIRPKDTAGLRGLIKLDERTRMYINPAVTSLSRNTGLLHIFEPLFYSGCTDIVYAHFDEDDYEDYL